MARRHRVRIGILVKIPENRKSYWSVRVSIVPVPSTRGDDGPRKRAGWRERPIPHTTEGTPVATERKRPVISDGLPSQLPDIDPEETSEWVESLDGVIDERGAKRARYVMLRLLERARERQVGVPPLTTTDYINTIPPEQEPWFPGDEYVERRIRAYIRWNAAMLVHRAQRPGDRRRRAHLDLRQLAPASTRSASTTSSGARTTPAAATRSSSRATPRPACTPARTSRAG